MNTGVCMCVCVECVCVECVCTCSNSYVYNVLFILFSIKSDCSDEELVNENPTATQFHKNTQALQVVNSFCMPSVRGNCRGNKSPT